MRRPWEVDRRAVLRGAGTAIGLPVLESMLPGMKRARAATTPKRLVFFVFTGGTPETTGVSDEGLHGCLRPKLTGSNYQTTSLLQPLDDLGLKQDILVISNLHTAIGEVGTGIHAGGDHPRSQMSLLTGVDPVNSDVPDKQAGISVDQLAAKTLKTFTPALPSLLLGVTASAQGLDYPSVACWSGPSSLVTPTYQTSEAFGQVFGAKGIDPLTLKKRLAYKQSVLQYAKDDTQRLSKKLGAADRETLDKYLTNILELEDQISASSATPNQCMTNAVPPTGSGSVPERLKQMLDMVPLAFQCDRTRVVVIHLIVQLARFDWLGPPYSDYPNYHDDIQHGGSQAMFGFTDGPVRMETYAKATTWMIEQFGKLVRKLKETPEGDGTGSLLDNTMAACTSEISYGNGHSMRQLPVIVAGRGGGAITPGRHIAASNVGWVNPNKPNASPVDGQPIANLWLSMLNGAGVSVPSFGNSTGPLALS